MPATSRVWPQPSVATVRPEARNAAVRRSPAGPAGGGDASGAGVTVAVGAGVAVAAGVGTATGTTGPVAAELALAQPSAFLATTCRRRRCPASAAVVAYVGPVAASTSLHSPSS